MKVIVDTSIWSTALGRSRPKKSVLVDSLEKLILEHRVQVIGPIRQEILSGLREELQFKKLEKHLRAFPDLDLQTEDYVRAAKYFNLCRSKGLQGSNTDFLICSVAIRNKSSIFTSDKDFTLFAKYLPIVLYAVN